ncbi:hypothetical protein DH2020_038579 [Rehmannia glutinosa]|uniref:Uncharacterized protein n=1 Tax=Rehmannia glutinosa TaxID=99300 RepID=A0ABR0UYS2_REHGL
MASSLSHGFHPSLTPSKICPFHKPFKPIPFKTPIITLFNTRTPKFSFSQTRATLDDDNGQISTTTPSLLVQELKQPNKCSQDRKVPSEEILEAFSVIEKAKLDPSSFLETLGGTKSPGRTWMLIFTAEKKLERGKYFPITAVQRFDAAGKRIENGVYLGPLGCLTFEGRFSWKKRILAFVFERIRIKIGPLDPFEFSFKGKDEREPGNQDPFFIWFYIDEEIAVARGRSGGNCVLGALSTHRLLIS